MTMHSLSTHLRSLDDHGRLAFHAECPVCRRERLAGALASEPIVSRRSQAVLVSGVLAFSAASPAAVFAAEPDQEQQGSLAPDQIAGAGPPGSPAYDPGGDAIELPPADAAAPRPPSPDPDGGGVEALDPDEPPAAEPVVDAGDEVGSLAPPEQSPADPLEPTQSVPAAPHQPATPGEPVAPPPNLEPTPAPPGKNQSAREKGRHRPSSPKPQTDGVTRSGRVASGHTAAVGQPPAAAPKAGAPAPADRAAPGDRFHVVEAGESLWSIAGDRLGGERSPARIAREVNRLWELNREQIGTGDPDLILVGTKLRLR
jgi:hypothetical protein